MILKSARITSFRSIEDSGEFSIDRVTGLVGENGAGKSTILEALYKLNPVVPGDAAFSPVDYPRKKYAAYRAQHATRPPTVVTTTWELDGDDRDLLTPLVGVPAVDSLTIRVSKGYDNQQRWAIDLDQTAIAQPERFADGDLQALIVDLMRDRLPKFVYVTEYPSVPGDVALDRSAASNRGFVALLEVAGVDPDVIQHIDDSEELIAVLEAASDTVSRSVFRHWQNGKHLRLEFRCETPRSGDHSPSGGGYVFRTRIRDARHGFSLGLDQHGAGIVGFLSAVVWIAHLKRTLGDGLVLLLDQPGMTLHAQAQRDLAIHISQTCRSRDTIVYATPSTSMVNDEPTSLRVVELAGAGDPVDGPHVREQVRLPALRAAVAAATPGATPLSVPPVSRDLPAASFDSPLRLLDPPLPDLPTFVPRPEEQEASAVRTSEALWRDELSFLRRGDPQRDPR